MAESHTKEQSPKTISKTELSVLEARTRERERERATMIFLEEEEAMGRWTK